jgi:hypothetical protein
MQAKVLGGKPFGKRPLGRNRHNWKDNIKMVLKKMGCEVLVGFSWFKVWSSDQLQRAW